MPPRQQPMRTPMYQAKPDGKWQKPAVRVPVMDRKGMKQVEEEQERLRKMSDEGAKNASHGMDRVPNKDDPFDKITNYAYYKAFGGVMTNNQYDDECEALRRAGYKSEFCDKRLNSQLKKQQVNNEDEVYENDFETYTEPDEDIENELVTTGNITTTDNTFENEVYENDFEPYDENEDIRQELSKWPKVPQTTAKRAFERREMTELKREINQWPKVPQTNAMSIWERDVHIERNQYPKAPSDTVRSEIKRLYRKAPPSQTYRSLMNEKPIKTSPEPLIGTIKTPDPSIHRRTTRTTEQAIQHMAVHKSSEKPFPSYIVGTPREEVITPVITLYGTTTKTAYKINTISLFRGIYESYVAKSTTTYLSNTPAVASIQRDYMLQKAIKDTLRESGVYENDTLNIYLNYFKSNHPKYDDFRGNVSDFVRFVGPLMVRGIENVNKHNSVIRKGMAKQAWS
jgi:hypothetical protein